MPSPLPVPAGLSEAVQLLAAPFFQGGCGAWSTMCGVECQFTQEGETAYGPPAALLEGFGPALVNRLAWEGDRQGRLWFAVAEPCARSVVAHMMALMMGGAPDLEKTALDAEGMDAYNEAANSFAGQGQQAIRGVLGGSLKSSLEPVRQASLPGRAEAEIGAGAVACHAGSLMMGGKGPYRLALLMEPSCAGVDLAQAGDSAQPEAAAGPSGAGPEEPPSFAPENLAHVMKLPVPLIVVLTEKKMLMEFLQTMAPGIILEFRKQSGEILDVCANQVKIAEAEVVTTNQHFGVQIRHMVDPRAARPA